MGHLVLAHHAQTAKTTRVSTNSVWFPFNNGQPGGGAGNQAQRQATGRQDPGAVGARPQVPFRRMRRCVGQVAQPQRGAKSNIKAIKE